MQDILEYLRQNIARREQLEKIAGIAGVLLAGALAVILIFKLVGWGLTARENRRWVRVHNVTPDRLIARCGQPQADNESGWPVVMREISYAAWGNTTIVLKFSRTADEPTNWVFVSMKDSRGEMSYDTPELKIAALPCLDSRE